MFLKIFELLVSLWEYLWPWFVIDQTEMGIVKRFGKFQRVVHPGLRWKWPIIEYYESEMVVLTPLNMSSQTLTTFDDKSVVVSAAVTYTISDIKAYLLNMSDAEEVLADIIRGEIQAEVTAINYLNIFDVQEKILPRVRKKLRNYGIKVKMVTFVDLGAIRTIRLIQES